MTRHTVCRHTVCLTIFLQMMGKFEETIVGKKRQAEIH